MALGTGLQSPAVGPWQPRVHDAWHAAHTRLDVTLQCAATYCPGGHVSPRHGVDRLRYRRASTPTELVIDCRYEPQSLLTIASSTSRPMYAVGVGDGVAYGVGDGDTDGEYEYVYDTGVSDRVLMATMVALALAGAGKTRPDDHPMALYRLLPSLTVNDMTLRTDDCRVDMPNGTGDVAAWG